MKLWVKFLDAEGKEVSGPIPIEHPDEMLAYRTAIAFRSGVEQRLGRRVRLVTEEA